MKKLFAPYNIALLAKKKGFNEFTQCAWVERDDLSDYPEPGTFIQYPDEYPNWVNYNQYDSLCSAPLYQQITDWFREKHNIHIKNDDFLNDDIVEWDYEIVKVGTDIDEKGNYTALVPYSVGDPKREGLSYYEALSQAILEAFKLLP